MYNTYNHVAIKGIRAVVPAHEISLEDEIMYYNNSEKKIERIKKMIGIDKRRICPDGVTASDLCAYAADKLLEEFSDYKDKIDVLIFVSQNPDWAMPATACELQDRLSLPKSCAAFDVNQGCSGYVYGLWLAGSFIESRAAKRILLLVGDVLPERDTRNRVIAPVFGDGGSATLLEYSEDAEPMYFALGTDGSGYDAIISPNGRARIPFLREHDKNKECVEDIVDSQGNPWQVKDIFMDGGRVFNFSMSVVPDHINELMAYANTKNEDIDFCILHQANKQIIENIATKVGFPLEKVPTSSFSKYGNLASASIPGALCEEFGEGKKPGKLLLSGYGVGLSWASCICTATNWNCSAMLDYTPTSIRTREENISQYKKLIQGKNS